MVASMACRILAASRLVFLSAALHGKTHTVVIRGRARSRQPAIGDRLFPFCCLNHLNADTSQIFHGTPVSLADHFQLCGRAVRG